MRKQDLARRLARRSGVTPAEAADQLDRMVHRIVAGLRRGEQVALQGLGMFKPGRRWAFDFEPGAEKGRSRDAH